MSTTITLSPVVVKVSVEPRVQPVKVTVYPPGTVFGSGEGGATSWADLSGKPEVFLPSPHTHPMTEVDGLEAALGAKLESVSYADVTGKPATFPPSEHTHDDRYYTETETDTLLSGKAAAAHTHPYSAITDKPTTFAPSAHAHPVSDVTGLQAALDGKETVGTAASAIGIHEQATDPHAQYQRESEKGAANGYASLGADGIVPATQLPASSPGGATLSNANPLSALVTPTPGTAAEAARADHRHPLGGPYHLRFRSGQYYGAYSTSLGTNAWGAGVLHATPFFVPLGHTFTGIALTVTTAGTGAVRLGIYRDTGGGQPGALLGSYGAIDAGLTGVQVITINVVLEPGLYWLASLTELSSGSVGVTIINGHTLGMPLNSATQGVVPGYAAAVSVGAFPDPFPANPSVSSAPVRVMLRAA